MKTDVKDRFAIIEYYGTEDPRDRASFRALFHFAEADRERKHAFSVDELEVRISSCKARGEPTDHLERALVPLRRMNESD